MNTLWGAEAKANLTLGVRLGWWRYPQAGQAQRQKGGNLPAPLFQGHAAGIECVLHAHGGRFPISNGAADSARRPRKYTVGKLSEFAEWTYPYAELPQDLTDQVIERLVIMSTSNREKVMPAITDLLPTAVAKDNLGAVRRYASELKQLYALGDGQDVVAKSKSLVRAAEAAIIELQPYLIRHGIDDLSASERKHFGAVGSMPWTIATAPASVEEIKLLLRMDRLLQLTPERKGDRRNDPRFHIGWQHVGIELDRASGRAHGGADHAVLQHIKEAKKSLGARCTSPHPKVAAVSVAIRPLLDVGEKVLLFCHHRATASELLSALEESLRAKGVSRAGPPENVWRAAWKLALSADEAPHSDEPLLVPIIDWLCSPGIRRQITGWLGEPANSANALADQFTIALPRNRNVSMNLRHQQH